MEGACLIIPPSVFLLDERVFPSLGVLRVAASLESQGVPVEVLDLSGIANYEEVVRLHASSSPHSFFGITATTPQMPAVRKLAQAIRSVRPDAHLCVGGPHPTLVAAACKREVKAGLVGRAHRALERLNATFDQVVAGDGEDAVTVALRRDLRLIDADDPSGPLFMTKARYRETPGPARHLIDLNSYHYTVEGQKATSLISQLGCPMACTFCGGRYSPMLRRIRTRAPESAVDEVRELHRVYGYTGFMFYDDELNVTKEMVPLMDGLAALQAELGVSFSLRGFIKAELFNDEQAAAMFRAGFRWMLTGFESGSPRVLVNIDKKATREENTACLETARRHGLKVKALMSIGHAGETEETVRETKEWLLETRPDDFDVTIITTYPGCPYYDDALETSPGVYTFTSPKTGDRLHAYEVDYDVTADYYKGDPDADGGYRSYVYTDALSAERLVELRDDLERSVRTALGIPFNPAAAAVQFEHSMGQALPPSVLRRSLPRPPVRPTVRLPVL